MDKNILDNKKNIIRYKSINPYGDGTALKIVEILHMIKNGAKRCYATIYLSDIMINKKSDYMNIV